MSIIRRCQSLLKIKRRSRSASTVTKAMRRTVSTLQSFLASPMCRLTVKPLVRSPANRGENQPSMFLERNVETRSTSPDLRTPLQRFRTKPQKALSVTDLVSPSWCELQYWYTLTKHGRKRQTPAMKQGSAIHKTLEDQVHQTVKVDIQTKEDAWGLRIWNIIQGLKTLRETGMTRELEVWGVVNGQVINGVIDELTYICPDRELEEDGAVKVLYGHQNMFSPIANQSSITSFLEPKGDHEPCQKVMKDLRTMRKKTSKVYITDVKTRGIRSIPKGPAFRPTFMQLMLYHMLLSNLATNKIDADIIFDRYGLDANTKFSDSFIAQLGGFSDTFYDAPFDSSHYQSPPDLTQDVVQILLDHNSLGRLWTLMIQEFQLTMPTGVQSLGNVLKAEYRDQSDGTILGIKTFLYDGSLIQEYVEDELRWWNGDREAQGVTMEEAYKCRSCEFAEGCSWRVAKVEEATDLHRRRISSMV